MTQRTGLIAIPAVLLTAALLWHIGGKMRAKLNGLDQQINQAQIQRSVMNQDIEALRVYQARWDTIRAFESQPLEERRNQFTAYFEELGRNSNIVFLKQDEPPRQCHDR